MTGESQSSSFFGQFRQRRDERRRLQGLRVQAERLRSESPTGVAERVVQDLTDRISRLEETERQELKTFVQGLKKCREELIGVEKEIEELPFRLRIGEIDDVERQLREESSALKARDLKHRLEENLKEYRALRAFLESEEARADGAEAQEEATRMLESSRFKRDEVPGVAPPSEEPEPVALPPDDDEEAAEVPPAAGGGQFPPLVVGEEDESVIVQRSFAMEAADSADEVDDLTQLDALSRSLDALAERGGGADDLRPLPMPTPATPAREESDVLDGIPSAVDLRGDRATGENPSPTDSHAMLAAQPMLLLKGQDGSERASFVLKMGVSTLGRGLDNEVVLDDRAVSRKHASLSFEGDGVYRITDLGSENGTYVNGKRITAQVLKDGDEIHLGKSTLVFACGR